MTYFKISRFFSIDLPHDPVHHLHDNLIDNMEEINHHFALSAQGSQHRTKSQAEKDDTQGVGSTPVSNVFLVFIRSISLIQMQSYLPMKPLKTGGGISFLPFGMKP